MKLKDYNKSYYSNLSFERDTEHRERTKKVYQHNYDAVFIEEDGISAKYKNNVMEYDDFVELVHEYSPTIVKFFTISRELNIQPAKDIATQYAIDNNDIFINAYGNTNTKVFDDGDNDLWINILGVQKHKYSGNYIMKSYVNKDLSQVDKRYTFAVCRDEEYGNTMGWSGTSFDQPYFAQLANKICTYAKELGYELNRGQFLELLYNIGELITIKEKDIYLISHNIDTDDIKNQLETMEVDNMPKNEVSSWAQEAWDWAKENELNDGVGAKDSVTEEQMMVFLKRLYDFMQLKK